MFNKPVTLFIVIATNAIFLIYYSYTIFTVRRCSNYFNQSQDPTKNSYNYSKFYYLWRPSLNESVSSDRILEQLLWMKEYSVDKEKTKNVVKQILVFDFNASYFTTQGKINCPDFDFSYCNITPSDNIENPVQSIGNYDAAIIMKNFKPEEEEIIPARTLQIIYTLESPSNFVYMHIPRNTLLASYHRRSDIAIPYGKWIPYENGIDDRRHSSSLAMKNFAEEKSAVAVMFVTNCFPSNNRMGYAHELKKYIKVDIFGRCGERTLCKHTYPSSRCMENTIKNYKFYLAFENSNCREYITEKFFRNALQYGAVPVVLGAHPDDYKAVAPFHSYISVEDFETPQKLAEYLQLLDKNDTLYNEYFRWTKSGYFYDALTDFFCRACGMILYGDHIPPPKWEGNMLWSAVSKCLPYNQWYWRAIERGG